VPLGAVVTLGRRFPPALFNDIPDRVAAEDLLVTFGEVETVSATGIRSYH
jgi:hypothetical protein